MQNNNEEHRAHRPGQATKPIEVAIIGGGCASLTAAFELTRPHLQGRYHVTIYQLGWRLGGKGASGRGAADRIEEHGLHIWLGFYENAFRLIRECYAELRRDPQKCPIADWEDAFFQDSFVGLADIGKGGDWLQWTTLFPAAPGKPGDPLGADNPFTIKGYVERTASLLRTLLTGVETHRQAGRPNPAVDGAARLEGDVDSMIQRITRLIQYGLLATSAGIAEAAARLEVILQALPAYPPNFVLGLLKELTRASRSRLEEFAYSDDDTRYIWEIIDLVLAILTGIVRFNIVTDPRGFDAINDYECREWLRENGASEPALKSAFVRGLFDLAMAYPGGDAERPALAAGQAVRGALRMFFSYRGALFWKMRAGMGDVVFAPLYEVLRRRGVSFKFFHRLENIRFSDAGGIARGGKRYVEALEFDVQAQVKGSNSDSSGEAAEYQPLIDVRGLPCWPAEPDFAQLVDGETLRRSGRNLESFWDVQKVKTKTLHVRTDFDFVVLGIGIGGVPYVCGELVKSDPRWAAMVQNVKSVPTQAFQVWMRESMTDLGWERPPVSLSGFVKPFDTWADMSHLADAEGWTKRPSSIAYFCSVLSDPPEAPLRTDAAYPARRNAEVRENAIAFLDRNVGRLWPKAVENGHFRWQMLMDPKQPDRALGAADASLFDAQFWTANVNPSDRYVLALPGSIKYRISPLDNTYDNFTIAGDWTDCGFTEGCVEAAVMSGRLAAHAISKSPPLHDIIGYDHP